MEAKDIHNKVEKAPTQKSENKDYVTVSSTKRKLDGKNPHQSDDQNGDKAGASFSSAFKLSGTACLVKDGGWRLGMGGSPTKIGEK